MKQKKAYLVVRPLAGPRKLAKRKGWISSNLSLNEVKSWEVTQLVSPISYLILAFKNKFKGK